MNAFKGFLALVPLVLLLSCGGGGGGNGGGSPVAGTPPAPTGLTFTQGATFDEVMIQWIPPAVPVDGYSLEDRINGGPFTTEPMLPGDIMGLTADLSPSVPELAQLGCRLRSVRGGAYSAYTPEATLFRGLRPPANPVVHTLAEDVLVSWTRGSQVASQVLVERAQLSAGVPGTYATVATLGGSATSYLDHPGDGPLVWYSYRIHYATLHNGTTVQSGSVAHEADQPTSLLPPANLQAVSTAQGARLDWTIQSRSAQGHRVERAPSLGADDTAFTLVALLGPAVTTYTDTTVPGPYTYRVRTTATAGGGAVSAPAEASVLMPPPAGPWNLQAQTASLPLGDGLARSAAGAWHVAANWCTGPANPMGLTLWRPTGATWDMRACGPVFGGGRFVSPGVLLDSAGRPHAMYLKDTGGPVIPAPVAVTHLWHDGTQWLEEAIATRQIDGGNVRYVAEFTLDPSDKLHVLWRAREVVNQISTLVTEYATNASGSWVVAPLPVTLVAEPWRLISFRLAAAPDGTVVIAMAHSTSGAQGPNFGSLLLMRKPAGGAWLEELALGESIYLSDEVPMVLLVQDLERVGLLYSHATTYPDPNEYRYAARTAAGWGSSTVIGDCATGSGYKVPFGAIRPDGSRIAALLPSIAGTTLVTWDATNGWGSSVLRTPDPFGLPWLAFDAQGNLHALVPAGKVGQDGFAPWIQLTSTP